MEQHVDIDELGAGEWIGAPPGKWQLDANDGFSVVRRPVTVPGPLVVLAFGEASRLIVEVPALVIEMPDPAGVEVTASLVSTPIPGSTARTNVRRRWASPLGTFSLRGLQPGLWEVTVRTTDGRSWTDAVELRDHEESRLLLH